ncbi:MAG: helix-turn-helix domain-containing protein [Candidatus Omnitrophica bacterium]|nr:helix-turn-helix domain-containing protein [Candidatus Omnitrophota bacterium]
MGEEKLLTVREVSAILGVSEKDILDLTQDGRLPGYKIGDLYLRFKKEQVEQYKKDHPLAHSKTVKDEPEGIRSRIQDFLYFNDFYIGAVIFIILLAYLVYRGL